MQEPFKTFQWLHGLTLAAVAWGFRPPTLEETPDDYASALADHCARCVLEAERSSSEAMA
jgi:hypothetical protein